MTDRQFLAFYGLKYNPFLPSIPVEDLWSPPGAESFLYRVENLVMDGGFGMITGDPGLGKSKLLQVVANGLSGIEGVVTGTMERPTSRLGDFYREMGVLFGLNLAPANRYGAFTSLREKWRTHIQNNLFRPVLLVDEAQEAATETLNEMRLLGSERFDSKNLLTVVLCGDSRLPDRFRHPTLLPLGTRVRTRCVLQPYTREDLMRLVRHLLDRAGAPHLCTPGLCEVLVDHCAGNPRVLCSMGTELLEVAAHRQKPILDEGLFLEVFERTPKKARGGKP